jgi:hypothetical protein
MMVRSTMWRSSFYEQIKTSTRGSCCSSHAVFAVTVSDLDRPRDNITHVLVAPIPVRISALRKVIPHIRSADKANAGIVSVIL